MRPGELLPCNWCTSLATSNVESCRTAGLASSKRHINYPQQPGDLLGGKHRAFQPSAGTVASSSSSPSSMSCPMEASFSLIPSMRCLVWPPRTLTILIT